MKRFILLFIPCFFVLSSCNKVFHHVDTLPKKYDMTSSSEFESDDEIEEMIAPYKKELDAKMNQVIGYAEKELVKELPECTLGNWASDAIHTECNKLFKKPIDFAVVNQGGIRIPTLPQGDITTGKIFELMPFDNMLVILNVKGDIVQQLFESIAARGGWPVSSSVRCSFTEGGELRSVTINGNPIDMEKTYQIGISDYVANGGDKCSFFKGQPQTQTGILFRDAFINRVKDLTRMEKNIDAEIEGRMEIVQ